jgi:hypothetical protein
VQSNFSRSITKLARSAAASAGLLAFVAPAPIRAAIPWSQGDSDPDEQNAMEYVNRARANPTGELTRILAKWSTDPGIAAILLPARRQLATGGWESLDVTAARWIADVATDLQDADDLSTEPLVFYPFFQSRAQFQRDNYVAFVTTEGWLTYSEIFDPVLINTDPLYPPPTGIYDPYNEFDDSTYTEPDGLHPGPVTGPNATGGTATFGPVGGNYSIVAQANLSVEGGLSLEQWMAFNLLDGRYGTLLQGVELPTLQYGHARLAGVDYAQRTAGPGTGAILLTIDYGDAQFFTGGDDLPYGPVDTVFITGVVFGDANGDGIYAPGEGLSGVTVSTDKGAYYAVTATAGGYAIPVPIHSGAYLVSATGPGFSQTASVNVQGQGVEADFVLPPPSFTAQPASQTIASGSTVVLYAAASGAPAPSYQWFLNGAALPGATAPRLVVFGATAANAGLYTCVATNAAGSATSGAATLTIASAAAPGSLVNESVTTNVQGMLTVGFVIGGDTSRTVLVRASGPALAAFGVTGVMPDPQIAAVRPLNASTVLAANAGWGGDPQLTAVGDAVGAFPFSDPASADSAVLLTLPPGPYTAQVTSASGAAGNVLVEVYEVP